MKNKIPTSLKEKFNEKNIKYDNFSCEEIEFLLNYASYYEWTVYDFKVIFKMLKNGLSVKPECAYTGCEQPVFIQAYAHKFSKCCCASHSVRVAMLEKHGVENPMHLQISKDNLKASMIKRYGVENSMQLQSSKDKLKNTMLVNHGVENIFKNSDFIKSKFHEKYGVENPSQLQEVKEKKKRTCLKNHGVEYPIQSLEIKEKTKKTNLIRHGIEYPIIDHNCNSFNFKEYHWKSGEVSFVQGFEPIVLKELEDYGYTFNDIKVEHNNVPAVEYEFEGKKRRYYPDIFIPKENLIIEVKSEWTYNLEKERNLRKFKAVEEAGYIFRLEIR